MGPGVMSSRPKNFALLNQTSLRHTMLFCISGESQHDDIPRMANKNTKSSKLATNFTKCL